jgi:hypothetical protein
MTEKLEILTGTQIQIDLPLFKKKIDSLLIRFNFSEYLILKLPPLTLEETSLYFSSGNDLILRFLHEGSIKAFKTTVISTVLNPYKLLFCAFPAEIRDHNLRKSPRIKCFLPASIIKEESNYDGIIVDLGKGGCLFSFNVESMKRHLFKPNDNSLISFKIPGVKEDLKIDCIIKNTKRETEGLSLGLQFVEISNLIINNLNEYITLALSFL